MNALAHGTGGHGASRKPFVVENKGNRKPYKPKPKSWSHQDDLKALVGEQVNVLFLSGKVINAKLVAADNFTFKLQFDQSEFTYFKHAAEGFGKG